MYPCPAFALPAFPIPRRSRTRTLLTMTSPTSRPTSPLSATALPAPHPISEYAQIDGVSVHHVVQPSPPAGILLICLHGFGASVYSFRALCARLLPPRLWLSFVAFDAVGFGLTSRPRNLRFYTPAFSSRIALALSNAYSPDRPFALLAHSLGSLGAARAALDATGKCKALILIAPAMVPQTPLPSLVRITMRAVMYGLAWATIGLSVLLNPLLTFILRRLVSSRSFWKKGLSFARADMKAPDDMVDGYYAATSAERWDKGILNFCRAALIDRARGLGEAEDYVTMLREMGEEAPRVLVVHGEQDRVVPVANSRRVVNGIPGARLVVMNNCGHLPHEEDPDTFAEIVAEFMEKAGLQTPDV